MKKFTKTTPVPVQYNNILPPPRLNKVETLELAYQHYKVRCKKRGRRAMKYKNWLREVIPHPELPRIKHFGTFSPLKPWARTRKVGPGRFERIA